LPSLAAESIWGSPASPTWSAEACARYCGSSTSGKPGMECNRHETPRAAAALAIQRARRDSPSAWAVEMEIQFRLPAPAGTAGWQDQCPGCRGLDPGDGSWSAWVVNPKVRGEEAIRAMTNPQWTRTWRGRDRAEQLVATIVSVRLPWHNHSVRRSCSSPLWSPPMPAAGLFASASASYKRLIGRWPLADGPWSC